MKIPQVLYKHLQPSEQVLAMARCRGAMPPAYAHLAVTDRRVFYVTSRGLLARSFHQIPVEALLSAGIEEGIINATIVIHARGMLDKGKGTTNFAFLV